MDWDFRASVIRSSNHIFSVQSPRLHSENYSVFNYTDGDDDSQPLFRCPFCDFEIEVSLLRSRLGEVNDPKSMVCPVCDEKLGEDATDAAQPLNSKKRNWKWDKSSFSSDDATMLEKKHAAWGNKQEPASDTTLSPFDSSASIQNPVGVNSEDDSTSTASDISTVKSAGAETPADSGDEQDHQERRQRASFVQALVLSTLSLDI